MSFSYINPTNRLKRDIKTTLLIKEILERVSNIPNHTNLRHDTELLKFICSIVENEIDNSKAKKKIDKKDIVFEVYKGLFGKTGPEDLLEIEKNIEYLLENKQIVKIGKVKKCFSICIDWIKRKLR